MSVGFRVVGWMGLEVGQWVQFSANEDIQEAPGEQKMIYGEKQCYLVFSREDSLSVPCSCFLVDIGKKIYNYEGRKHKLREVKLIDKTEIREIPRATIEAMHGVEKVNAVYEMAQIYIDNLKDYFRQYPVQLLDHSSTSEQEAKQFQKLAEIIKSDEEFSKVAMLLMLAEKSNGNATNECIIS